MWKTTALVSALVLGAVIAPAQGQSLRFHDETTGGALALVPATEDAGDTVVDISTTAETRVISGNGIPDHLVGSFPNNGNPHGIEEQDIDLKVPTNPTLNDRPTELSFGWNFGVTTDGVVFDPLAAEFWAGDRSSGWTYNALGGAFSLGLDENHAHVQPTGTYHYHGLPMGLIEMAGWRSDAHSPLIGYAADGFPIYALTGIVDGTVQMMTSSYQLIDGERPGGSEPDGVYDGTFDQDYLYVAGSGTLDECNGTMTVSAEYPEGTYAYFLTDDYPVIPRCFAGTPDDSFRFGPNR